MREQLIQYINLLFAGAPDSEDIKQEILQNTLDRYDDLLAQGKQPEAAYSLAISGIGDINEILSSGHPIGGGSTTPAVPTPAEDKNSRLRTAVAVAMYILCPVPLFLWGNVGDGVIGVSIMFILIAGATALLVMNRDEKEEDAPKQKQSSPRQEIHKSIRTLIWAIGLALYFLVSFTTHAWYITWVIFPLTGAVQGLIRAILDLKEANQHEN